MNNTPIKLHLGCGKDILPGWINLDSVALPGVDVVADLDNCATTPLPFANDSINEFYASHLLEHIKNPLSLMQELYRIAAPGASAKFQVPYGSSDDAYEDPTHVRPYFLNSFGYFSQPMYWRADYLYKGDWQPEKITLFVSSAKYQSRTAEEIMKEVNYNRNVVLEMHAELKAIKPARPSKKELQIAPKLAIVLHSAPT